jgi:hypothetical protein
MKSLIAALAVIALPGLAQAAPNIEAVFGNTIVSTYPDGRVAYLWLRPDGSYELLNRRRTTSGGAWTIKGEDVCMKQSRPIPAPITFCTPAPTGDSAAPWKAKALTGEQVSVKLVKGIVR